jgi:hemolysin activation/secretion protein
LNQNKTIRVKWLLLMAGALSSSVQAGAPLPDAGQVMRELQQEQKKQFEQNALESQQELKPAAPLAAEPDTPTTAQMRDDTKIAVKWIRVMGARKFSARTLQALVADLLVGEHSLSEIEAGVSRITAYYRKRGYLLASAYIPEQDIKDGELNVVVLEGLLDQVKLKNTAKVSDDSVLSYLTPLHSGEALQKSEIERKLLLLRSTVGVDKVSASLQGGAKAGTSDLLVETTPSAPYNGRIQLSNYGNRYTGEYQLGASFNINSPLKIGDQLSIRAVGSTGDLLYGRLAYQLPVGGDGLRIGAAYARNRYQLGREFESLDAYGTSETASLFATYPFILSQTASLTGTLAYENKKLNDRMDSVSSETDKQVQLVSLGLRGERLDTLNGGGRNTFDAAFYAGHLNMNAMAQAEDAGSARSSGDFVKATYMFNRLQRVTDQDTFSMTLSGQWAGNNLNSSEKYSLGGSFGVRSYPQGEASGDMGSMLNLELAHNFTPQLRGVLFYDYGHIRINRNDFSVASADNRRTLAGAGLGVNVSLYGLQLDSYLAWPTQGGKPLSEPESSTRIPRLWVQMSSEF